jgi:glutathione synthase/RimK-type ligase-like ATP-grasp enzyme
MDKKRLAQHFQEAGFKVEFITYSQIDFRTRSFKGENILYTSSEDAGLFYKSYIEDIIYGLELQGARLLPPFKYLRAHHNKVFLEILRDLLPILCIKNIKSRYFGTLEDLKWMDPIGQSEMIIKGSAGASSEAVRKASNGKQLFQWAKKLSRTTDWRYEIRDLVRFFRHRGYKRESRHRKKFVVQNYVSDMKRDWKVLVFGKKYYVTERRPRKNDFRASGSGIFSHIDQTPEGLLDFAKEFYEAMNLPFLSIDMGFDGDQFCLIEFQALNFGTHFLHTSPYYFVRNDNGWQTIEQPSQLEPVFVQSVVDYLR